VIARDERTRRFERLALPHLGAAYNLARWLLKSDADAEDAVQDAVLRAFRFFDNLRHEDGKAWLLTIVRHCCYDWLRRNRAPDLALDEESNIAATLVATPETPESLYVASAERRRLDGLVAELPAAFREVLILREQEELSYKEIADIVGAPVGTVMSRLARARALVRRGWEGGERPAKETQNGM
jgi:RNA polymerase sigma-70 factor (ECF subfamily)